MSEILDLKIKDINLSDFDYDLPEGRIAQHATAQRGQSKLLIYKSGNINHTYFPNLKEYLPQGSTLIFNNTRVIPARLYFQKSSGATIEVFLTEPLNPSGDFAVAMASKNKCLWKTMIGNLKKWKDDETLTLALNNHVSLTASLIDREQKKVEFTWTDNRSFSEILEETGNIPLPPYVKREVEKEDTLRYQTVYSKNEGAVAAPTAGLHFTEKLLHDLQNNGFEMEFLTLHVSAGTFKPINSDMVIDHPMHSEFVSVKKEVIERLKSNEKIIPVGTTSMRTLESLYWYGVKIIKEGYKGPINISKLYPYQWKNQNLPARSEAIEAILEYMASENLDKVQGTTEIFIVPGYQFRICKGIITNFHMPKSTLILLISALIGPSWRDVYDYAMRNEFRFLSYGDSSLLIP